jgi:hypothetical protein
MARATAHWTSEMSKALQMCAPNILRSGGANMVAREARAQAKKTFQGDRLSPEKAGMDGSKNSALFIFAS